MRAIAFALFMTFAATAAHANDWEKFYRPIEASGSLIPATQEPEIITSAGDAEQDLETMWRRGFAPIGSSFFNSPNPKTGDALRIAKKPNTRYILLQTRLVSSSTSAVPLTMPNTTTSVTNGRASVNGSGGYASGTYSGTTTTYGSQTTYLPITINRFDKMAVYFGEVPKRGLGVMTRELTSEEMALVDTRRAIVVRFVRDESPAYLADLLPGDILTQVNGEPFDQAKLAQAAIPGNSIKIHLFRRGQQRDVELKIPAEWRTP